MKTVSKHRQDDPAATSTWASAAVRVENGPQALLSGRIGMSHAAAECPSGSDGRCPLYRATRALPHRAAPGATVDQGDDVGEGVSTGTAPRPPI